MDDPQELFSFESAAPATPHYPQIFARVSQCTVVLLGLFSFDPMRLPCSLLVIVLL